MRKTALNIFNQLLNEDLELKVEYIYGDIENVKLLVNSKTGYPPVPQKIKLSDYSTALQLSGLAKLSKAELTTVWNKLFWDKNNKVVAPWLDEINNSDRWK